MSTVRPDSTSYSSTTRTVGRKVAWPKTSYIVDKGAGPGSGPANESQSAREAETVSIIFHEHHFPPPSLSPAQIYWQIT